MTGAKTMQRRVPNHANVIGSILQNLRDCDEMVEMGASFKAVVAFLEIAIGCYGKDLVQRVIADFGSTAHKRYAALLAVL